MNEYRVRQLSPEAVKGSRRLTRIAIELAVGLFLFGVLAGMLVGRAM